MMLIYTPMPSWARLQPIAVIAPKRRNSSSFLDTGGNYILLGWTGTQREVFYLVSDPDDRRPTAKKLAKVVPDFSACVRLYYEAICGGLVYMETKTKRVEKPPSNLDVQDWADLVNSDGLNGIRPEDIVAAIQDIGLDGDQGIRSALTGHISEAMLKVMNGKVRKTYKDQGKEIIWRTHHQLIIALLTKDSADGMALRETFRVRVELRLKDSIRNEIKYHSRFRPLALQIDEDADSAESEMDPPNDNPVDYAEQTAHVESVLNKISDPRKRNAFRLYMEQVPISPGKGTTSIAHELSISAKTAGEWIKEIQVLLAAQVERDPRRET